MSFKTIETNTDLEQFITDNELAFLYISRPNCSVCKGLLPQVEEIMKKYPKIALGYVNADQLPDVAGKFSIFTVPVLLLLVDGKEYLREARIVHLQQFEEKIEKIYQGFYSI
ncbi:thioredoxin-like protein YdfQ [Paraliobacillus quinghaiensis]|uniref:Thioredoxin-like protein YdfQ n=1 Tax=Paraliobacillus quinghaiensis TaxID=470815 RepID=A0A917TD96_9BACI|nr:thioredoxin family protein [Paraliobacillus quinghaiensis]GGM19185.1 thioredoxin-like protein YdfQ [Paraliobacillus quinghaiensis]